MRQATRAPHQRGTTASCRPSLSHLVIRMYVMQIEGHWHLFVLDAYHGLFRLNMTRCDPFRSGEEDDSSCQVRHLFNAKINVQLPPELSKPKVREIRGNLSHPRLFESAPKFFNDFDISPLDGCVYFTDSSYKWSRSNNRSVRLHLDCTAKLL